MAGWCRVHGAVGESQDVSVNNVGVVVLPSLTNLFVFLQAWKRFRTCRYCSRIAKEWLTSIVFFHAGVLRQKNGAVYDGEWCDSLSLVLSFSVLSLIPSLQEIWSPRWSWRSDGTGWHTVRCTDSSFSISLSLSFLLFHFLSSLSLTLIPLL